MKKILFTLLIFSAILVDAKICTKSCYSSAGGYGMGYGWSIPNGGTCGAIPFGSDVYYAYATTEHVFDQGVIENYAGFGVGC